MPNYEITVTRGQFRTVWGRNLTKQKAKEIVKSMTSKQGKSRLKPSIHSFRNPRIKKMRINKRK